MSSLVLVVVAVVLALASFVIGICIFRYTALRESKSEWLRFEREAAIRWFPVNCIILAVGALGIVGFILDAHKVVAELQAEDIVSLYRGALEDVRSDMQFYNSWFCRMKINYPSSDADAKDKDDEQAKLCDWFQSAANSLDNITSETGRSLKFNFPSSKYFSDMVIASKRSYVRFDAARNDLLQAEAEARAPYRPLFLGAASALLALAFGLSLAKARFVP
jgi:hypothetical protein